MKEVRDAAKAVADEATEAAHQVAREVRDALHEHVGEEHASDGRRHRRRHRRRHGARFGSVVWGGVLLMVGSFMLLERFGFDMPNVGDLWPVFPLMFGLAFLTSYFFSDPRDPGLVWPGTFFSLLGSFFFLFTMDVFDWEDMAFLWPMYPLMVGTAFTATWLTGRCRDGGLFGAAAVTLLVGTVGLSMTTGVLAWGDVRYLWPLALILIGGSMVFRSLRSSS